MANGDDIVLYDAVSAEAVAGLFDPDSPESISPEDRAIVGSLIVASHNLDVVLPDTLSAAQIWDHLQLCCRVLVRARRAVSLMKILVGRTLVLIQQNPLVYERRGFGSFDQFMSNTEIGLPSITGISRAELYKAKAVAEAAPTLSMIEAHRVGFTKLAMIARVTTEASSDFPEWMDAAASDTVDQLKERIYRSDRQIPQGDLEFDVLQLTVTKSQKERFDSFSGNPKIQAYCGTPSPGSILERMIEEVENTWLLGIDADVQEMHLLPL